MSPTPTTFASPTKPASWSWEATSESVAARYGLPVERVVRFDQNTAPLPPEAVRELLAAARFEAELSEYPPSDYGRLVEAAAERYGVAFEELLVGAGADEILDLSAKAFLPAGGAAIVPMPTYPMYGILTDQRRAAVVRVPRRDRSAEYALDSDAIRAAAAEPADNGALPTVVWLCSPNNPTGRAEPEGAVADLLAGLARDADAAGRPLPTVVLDEAYIEFAGPSLAPLRQTYPRLVVLRKMSKAYSIAGLRSGFALARPEVIAEIAVYRPPGSVSTVSVDIAAALLADPSLAASRVEAIAAERERFIGRLREAGWDPQPSTTNFVLVTFGSPGEAEAVAEGLLSRGIIPRTFGEGHPLAHCLRLTVRNEEQDDRLVEAAGELAAARQRPPAP
jgi:histidinol-phosphate aminotransferase